MDSSQGSSLEFVISSDEEEGEMKEKEGEDEDKEEEEMQGIYLLNYIVKFYVWNYYIFFKSYTLEILTIFRQFNKENT